MHWVCWGVFFLGLAVLAGPAAPSRIPFCFEENRGQAGAANSDADPFSNAQEYIADTDPDDSNDWFHISGFSGGTVFFQSSENRIYTLLQCANLASNAWKPAAAARMGVGGADSITSTNRPPVGFYKITVELP